MAARRREARTATDRALIEVPDIPPEVMRLLSVLPGASLLVTVESAILFATPRAETLGLVRGQRLGVATIREMVRKAATEGITRERELRVRKPPLGRGLLDLRVLVAPLSPDVLAVIVEDLSEERRVDAVRRDFVANVSHELKTPVGAIALLAEAMLSSSGEPDQMTRFAERMHAEAVRLTSLVNDVIDLSRLQSDDPLAHAEVLEVDHFVTQAVDEVRNIAEVHEIELVFSGAPGLQVLGDRLQLVMAVRNLLVNAIAYSAAHTRVAVAVRAHGSVVEIDVKDQGRGIPSHDLDRIFERFYRVDPARSRSTGGTGLGLALVKHVCQNHGGECTVWSEVGVGSTFTLRLPLISETVATVEALFDSEMDDAP